MQTRAQHFLTVIGRVRPDVTLTQAAADLEPWRSPSEALRRDKRSARHDDGAAARGDHGDARQPMLLLGVAVALLLAIGAVTSPT